MLQLYIAYVYPGMLPYIDMPKSSTQVFLDVNIAFKTEYPAKGLCHFRRVLWLTSDLIDTPYFSNDIFGIKNGAIGVILDITV